MCDFEKAVDLDRIYAEVEHMMRRYCPKCNTLMHIRHTTEAAMHKGTNNVDNYYWDICMDCGKVELRSV